MSLDIKQKQALELMRSGGNVFLTGKAGSGKTKVIDEFKKSSSKTIAVLAPTGIAALNAGGATIHSFFKLDTKLLAAFYWLNECDFFRRSEEPALQRTDSEKLAFRPLSDLLTFPGRNSKTNTFSLSRFFRNINNIPVFKSVCGT